MINSFFSRDRDGFAPSEMTRSPWDPNTISGAAIGGLLAFLLDEAIDHTAMTVARLTVDILGNVPYQRLIGRVVTVRDGRQMQVLCAELIAGQRVVARATALRVRSVQTPAVPAAMPFPAPETIALAPCRTDRPLLQHMRTRPVNGRFHEPGPGTMWAAFDIQIVAGSPITPLARATVLGDFGSGVGSALSREAWNFANLDIAIHFLRMPQGEWLLVDSSTESEGNGFAVARCIFADRNGVYGRGFQTLFVTPKI